ncbi:DUF934 domain-containing protein [Psychrobacter lutiphocae]|uniref:DUF934 domain-containing protein n=1 Tax=Psychrobacter lutiphocae TaxID=540500 RepID=UPI000362937D|nr:DUF934 domain-containing protein [Psychrobacter lutiphocae]
MGNYHILDSQATDITAQDNWYVIDTKSLPENLAIKNIHLSELLHKKERLDVILPFTDVLNPQDLLAETLGLIHRRSSRIGLWANTDLSTEQIDTLLKSRSDDSLPLLQHLDLIILYQPSFADGRSFSQARHLRQQGYEGEIRIAGDFGVDQIAYLKRAGIDSFIITAEDLNDDVVNAFYALPSSYDGSVANQLPMFRT